MHDLKLNSATTLTATVTDRCGLYRRCSSGLVVAARTTSRRGRWISWRNIPRRRPSANGWRRIRDFTGASRSTNATVVFHPTLSGFAALSERTDPDTLRDLVEGRLALVKAMPLQDRGGVITGFFGDAPPDPVRPAAKCLLVSPRDEVRDIDLHRAVARWSPNLPPAIEEYIGFKIGAHYGPIVASGSAAATRTSPPRATR